MFIEIKLDIEAIFIFTYYTNVQLPWSGQWISFM